ncbi:MAG: glycosyltransferase family 2 protein [Candidatus Methanoliparum thermophilum]|uniref:Glycosyltransferase family 2 protein n=1 Tax=Methanoliparum thermophilum TaxID=2491083 RepID=A0A520KT82_METT2|nr:MAG: glycosyltransferase family 2 protein [Candidatus Methanoliparum thermophilum]
MLEKKPLYKTIAIIPVSSSEPVELVKKSIESMESVKKYSDYNKKVDLKIIYVIDDSKKRVYLEDIANAKKDESIEFIFRLPSQGKKAAALNDALEKIYSSDTKPDFLAFFDVDSRPKEDFIDRCIDVFETNLNDNIALVSGPRFIINEESFIQKLVGVEYLLINDLYRFSDFFYSYKHFNGLIGLVRGDLFDKIGFFDENKICEDLDICERIYINSLKIVYTDKAIVKEQAPLTLNDFYKQRIRWMIGHLEGINAHLNDFLYIKNRSIKISWLLFVFLPFNIVALQPFFMMYYCRVIQDSIKKNGLRNIRSLLEKFVALMVYPYLMEFSSFNAIFRYIKNDKRWEQLEREFV